METTHALEKVLLPLAEKISGNRLSKYEKIAEKINNLETLYAALSDQELANKTVEFRHRLQSKETTLEKLLPEAYAVVREASKRTLGIRHHDVQLMAGIVLNEGSIAEQRTGEGKTITATLPLYLNALEGQGAHLATSNDYLARRDARIVAPIFQFLGMSVGVIQNSSEVSKGQAYLVDFSQKTQTEKTNNLRVVSRKAAYLADITYGACSEFGFDSLRDDLATSIKQKVQRGKHFVVVDEVDNVLIDEAKNPLIISGPSPGELHKYTEASEAVSQLKPGDYEVNEKDRKVYLTASGTLRLEQLLQTKIFDMLNPGVITVEQARMWGHIDNALTAHFLYKKNKDYLVKRGKVEIIDQDSGKVLAGRRWGDGVHQAVEAKEKVKIQPETVTYASTTTQNFFLSYDKLSGMSGTALSSSEEFSETYDLDVVVIPPHIEYLATRKNPLLVKNIEVDYDGNRLTVYRPTKNNPDQTVYYDRQDLPDIIYPTEEAKYRAVVLDIIQKKYIGRPVLAGTTSVEQSETFANRLNRESVQKLLWTKLIRDQYLRLHNQEERYQRVEELAFINDPLEKITLETLINKATELSLPTELTDFDNQTRIRTILNLAPDSHDNLKRIVENGIQCQVLNAVYNEDEARIIAGAGEFGAVTIATNMAGRGVDIKLGGEIAEEILQAVNLTLAQAGYPNPSDMGSQEKLLALRSLPLEAYPQYSSEIAYYINSQEEAEKVHKLGGLHIIGTERHEARRIDNQLRGRAARQGDPGSTRFYLSLQDEIVRKYGHQAAEKILKTFRIDDSVPLQSKGYSKIVIDAQERAEGANFDLRKHVFEYDEVLTKQKRVIFTQKDHYLELPSFDKTYERFLDQSIAEHIAGLNERNGHLKYITWIDGIQLPLTYKGKTYQSFGNSIVLNEIKSLRSSFTPAEIITSITQEAIAADVEFSRKEMQEILVAGKAQVEPKVTLYTEALDEYFSSLEQRESPPITPQGLLADIQSVLGLNFFLNAKTLNRLPINREKLHALLLDNLELSVLGQIYTQVGATIKSRIPGFDPNFDPTSSVMTYSSYEDYSKQVSTRYTKHISAVRKRVLGKQGELNHLLNNNSNLKNASDEQILFLISQLQQSTVRRSGKGPQIRTVVRNFNRFHYLSSKLQEIEPRQLAKLTKKHLLGAKSFRVQSIGDAKFNRLTGVKTTRVRKKSHSKLNPPSIVKLRSRLSVRKKESRMLAPTVQFGQEIVQVLDDETHKYLPLASLSPEEKLKVKHVMGKRVMTENLRKAMVNSILLNWSDHLKSMEAMRTSIGTEAYAQRDPLIAFKNQTEPLFDELSTSVNSDFVDQALLQL